MKRSIIVCLLTGMSSMGFAKDLVTTTFVSSTKIQCENCVRRIKENLRFVKGVKDIDVSLEKQTITVTYDRDKTGDDAFKTALKKINYNVTVAEGTKADNAQKPEPKSKEKR